MLRFTEYGSRELILLGVISGSLILVLLLLNIFIFKNTLLYSTIAVIAVLAFLLSLFFRDPERLVTMNDATFLAPADGVIKDITILSNKDLSAKYSKLFEGKKVVRIGIFLSVFNVHLNRAPQKMTVRGIEYLPGKFLDARDKNAGKLNESNAVLATATCGKKRLPMVVKQISGAIARRIVCPIKTGATLTQGERFGMIKFGSRTELYLPADAVKVQVRIGQPVTAGMTIMAELSKK